MKPKHLTALFVLFAWAASLNYAAAQSRIFDFFIENPAAVEVKVTLTAGHCYEGSMPHLQEYFIKPGERRQLGQIARVQGNGCDGENGHFRLEFSPAHREGSTVNFYFDNAGSLWTGGANQYPGTLLAKSGNGYTYSTYKWPTASEVEGRWSLVCAGICNLSITEGFTKSETNERSHTDQVKNAVSVSVKAGVKVKKIYSAETSVSYSHEQTMINTMTKIVNNTETRMQTETVHFTPDQMKTLGIHAVWRWEGATMYDGKEYLISTVIQTCTSGTEPPTYTPFSAESVGKCSGH